MRRRLRCLVILGMCVASYPLSAAEVLTWQQVRDGFLTANPSLRAGQIAIQENGANEITAGLLPNPQVSITTDQYEFFPSGSSPWRPLSNAQFIPVITQLWERRHKRQLRVESAKLTTEGSRTDQMDLERNLVFNLRDAFNRTLQAKSLLELAEENLKYYDKVIQVNEDRFKAGDIAKIDFQRVELQKVQFESDLASAQVNLRTAKIQMLTLLNRHSPVDEFDISGTFEYAEAVVLLPELRQQALDTRPDLRSALTAVSKAETENRLAYANGSTDPTIGAEYLWNPQVNNTIGMSVSIPLRIFDRNQGEKLRTSLEIRRAQQLREGMTASVYRDVDSAYATLEGVRVLIRTYRQKYLQESQEVRDLVSFSYSHGGASLVEFLDAQKSYRDTQLAYRNLLGSYYSAVAQLNLAVGQEVIQ